jgi:dienelactone hydrolase
LAPPTLIADLDRVGYPACVRFPIATALVLGACSPSPEAESPVEPKSDAPAATEWLDLELQLAGENVPVYVYRPATTAPAPLAVVVHGFKRSREEMKGWGQRLADAGFVVAVPSLPGGFAIDHALNGRIVGELAQWLADASVPELEGRVDPRRRGLMGFSAGGLAVMLAAASQPEVGLVVALDGVDRGDMGARAAASIQAPVVALWAEPASCNARGNGHAMVAAGTGPRREAKVVDATHCDPEWPSDVACGLLCGAPDPTRQAAFRTHAVRAFEIVLGCVDDEAWRTGTSLREAAPLSDVVIEGELAAHPACASAADEPAARPQPAER